MHILPIPLVTLNDLPGPNTKSKSEAVRYAHQDPRFASMLDVAADTQWPTAFHDDLYRHDLAYLQQTPGALIWILRDHGTHLYEVECENGGDAMHARTVISYHSGHHKLNSYESEERGRWPRFYHVYAGGEIREIGHREAYGMITVKQAEALQSA